MKKYRFTVTIWEKFIDDVRILACDSVNVIFYLGGDFYTIHAYLCDVFLGSSRSLRKIPTRS